MWVNPKSKRRVLRRVQFSQMPEERLSPEMYAYRQQKERDSHHEARNELFARMCDLVGDIHQEREASCQHR